MRDPEFRAEYDALAEEFALVEALIKARAHTNLTQDQIAERMGTSRTAVVRLESGPDYNPTKASTTVRIDTDVLLWLRGQGKGYQSRINAILRWEMLASLKS